MKQGGQHGGGGTEAAGGAQRENPWEAVDNNVSGLVTGQMQETFTTTGRETRVFGERGIGSTITLRKGGPDVGGRSAFIPSTLRLKGHGGYRMF